MTTFYKGESINASNGAESNLPTFGRFGCIIRELTVTVNKEDADENGDCWAWYATNGCCGSMFASEDEAQEAGNAYHVATGWSTDRKRAEAQAIEAAKTRHAAHAHRETMR